MLFTNSEIIDKDSYVPIYVQLKSLLKEQIINKKIKADERIPSENELTKQFAISRMTVRHAIKELEREGVVYTRRGEGSFVKDVSNTQMLIKLDGFSTQMQKQGFKVSSEILAIEEVCCCLGLESAYQGLGARKDDFLVKIQRIRYLDATPFALETSFLNHDIGKGLLKRKFGKMFSIFRYLEDELDLHPVRADHTIEPRLAEKKWAKLLQVKPKSPVLSLRGTTFAADGKTLEYLEGIYRGDLYKLEVEIRK